MTAPVCSDTSRARSEPLVATASRVERWLLVEHSGAWGPESVPSSRMEPAVARGIAETARVGAARLLMVRRHRDEEAGEPGRWVFAVDSRPGSEQIRARHVDDDDELLRLEPWSDPDGWVVVPFALYLVCTHGRHDRCCAVRGRPVAHALSSARPRQVWECSHVGGDRFAPNLVVLPEGLYVGRVEADDVVGVVEGLEAGLLPEGLVRGRSSLPLPVQAAQQFARAASARLGIDDLLPVRQETVEPDVWRVVLDGAPQVEVVVRYVRDGTPAVLSCGDPAKVAPGWSLVSLR